MSCSIEDISKAIRTDRFRIIDHADEEMVADGLRLDDVIGATIAGEIIEKYPTDRPLPSCLVFGCNVDSEPIHSVWAYNQSTGWAVLITTYRPDPAKWIDFRQRRPSDERN